MKEKFSFKKGHRARTLFFIYYLIVYLYGNSALEGSGGFCRSYLLWNQIVATED